MRSAAFTVGLLVALSAYADCPARVCKARVTDPAPSQKIFLDPITKRPRTPTPEELSIEQAKTAPVVDAKMASVPRTVTFPDGVVGFYPGKTKNNLLAHRDKNGRITMICSDGSTKKAQP